jgi:transposase
MWTAEHRRARDRRSLRYPSDMTDAEWSLVAPLIPAATRGGRRRSIVEAAHTAAFGGLAALLVWTVSFA